MSQVMNCHTLAPNGFARSVKRSAEDVPGKKTRPTRGNKQKRIRFGTDISIQVVFDIDPNMRWQNNFATRA